ncbi:MAG: DUF1343 domain-containing protein [Oscillospiraceae bacterium]|nr:DUF1343 domain-containing protein [Oscillospiraceae bacterium]
MLKIGADRAAEYAGLFAGRVALFCNAASCSSQGIHTADLLRPLCDLRLLLAPEHGLRGTLEAGEVFGNGIDPSTGLPVYSAYSAGSQRIPFEVYDLADTIVYDIQDVGCRYYTYISSLRALVEDCARYKKRLVVLDRPNPLGSRVEGSTLLSPARSFVGCYEMPVRYGLTCGEFAGMVRQELNLDSDVHIVPCQGLDRSMTFSDWGKAWVNPSPNLRSYEAALLYPGTCLLEGTNCSEGRGTPHPFTVLGAPYICAHELCEAFSSLTLPGITAQAAEFTPTASKYAGQHCEGLRLKVASPELLQSYAVGIHLLDLLRRLYPNSFQFLPLREGESLPFISQLAGHRLFEDPDWSVHTLLQMAENDSAAFLSHKQQYHLY